MLDIVFGFGLVIVTALMAFWIWRTFTSQNKLNSVNLCKTYFDDVLNNHKKIWSEIGINNDEYKKTGKYVRKIEYNSNELIMLLVTMETVSVLVVKGIIRIDFAYEIFSTLYFPYFYDEQIRDKIRDINEKSVDATYYNNYIKTAKLCKKYFENNQRLNYRDRMHW